MKIMIDVVHHGSVSKQLRWIWNEAVKEIFFFLFGKVKPDGFRAQITGKTKQHTSSHTTSHSHNAVPYPQTRQRSADGNRNCFLFFIFCLCKYCVFIIIKLLVKYCLLFSNGENGRAAPERFAWICFAVTPLQRRQMAISGQCSSSEAHRAALVCWVFHLSFYLLFCTFLPHFAV